MAKKTKGRSGGDRAAQKIFTKRDRTSIRSLIKSTIVRLALWGVIPASMATWLIQRGGLKHV